MAWPEFPTPYRSTASVAPRVRSNGVRELVLLKRNQRYVFTCAPGEEAALLQQLRQMAREPDSGIEWFDAALLARHLGATLGARLEAGHDHHSQAECEDSHCPLHDTPNPPTE